MVAEVTPAGRNVIVPSAEDVLTECVSEAVQFINLPNRDYWLAPERRPQTFGYLRNHAIWLACLVLAFLTVVYYAVLQANTQAEPRLPENMLLLTVGFLALTGAWVVTLLRHLRLPAARGRANRG